MEFFAQTTLVAAAFRKSGIHDRLQVTHGGLNMPNLLHVIILIIINAGQMRTGIYANRMCDSKT